MSTRNLDSGLASFVTLARFHNIAIDASQLRNKLAIEETFTEKDILRAAKEIGLKSRATKVSYRRLHKLPTPLIAGRLDGGFMIIAQADTETVLVLFADKKTPEVMKVDDFRLIWNDRIMLFTPRDHTSDSQKFGFRWFLPIVLKYKKPLLDVLAAALMLQVLGLFSPLITQVVIDKVLVHNSLTTLHVLVVGLLIIALFEMIMTITRSYIFTHTTSRIDVMLGSRLFNHLLSLPLRYFETRRIGDTIARVKEVETIRQFLTGTPMTTFIDGLFMIVYIVVMLAYSPTLTWVVLGSLPLFVLLSAIITPLFKRRLDDKFYTGAEQQSYLVESVTGAQTIKSFALAPQMQRKWEELTAKYAKASFKTSLLSGNAGAIGQFIQKIVDLLILWLGATLVIDGHITVGQLIAFRMLSGRVSGPVLRVVQSWQDFQQASMSVRRIGDIFNTKPEISKLSNKTRLPNIKGKVQFDKVTFRYSPDAAEAIKDVSFNIRPGEVVGIVGRSGSGKSTLSKLLQRLYVPEGGKILVDGVDITTTDTQWLRSQMGVVLQENFLFNASVRDNIAIHAPMASMEQIVRVAEVAGAHNFILELPDGYDTVIGEHGTGLSGGQKQRVAIARALLHNPRILLFDEATSALDYESESIIQQNLKEICKGRTVIIIAHRLSTLKDAHKILALERGKLVEYGTRESLMKKRGLYHHLHQQQERGEVC